MIDDPRFPTGKFQFKPDVTPEIRQKSIASIRETPAGLRAAVRGLAESQVNTPYREGGWTVRQVVHHVPESHMNAFVRFKLALTEDNPTIKPYDENAWAQLADMQLPIEVSLALIEQVHARWLAVLRSLKPAQLQRTFVHPEHGKTMTLGYHAQNYGWHSRHHVAHITALRRREGW